MGQQFTMNAIIVKKQATKLSPEQKRKKYSPRVYLCLVIMVGCDSKLDKITDSEAAIHRR